MRLRSALRPALLLSTSFAFVLPGCADTVEEEEGTSEEELKKLPASSILGSIAYGETKELMIATNTYRVWKFEGAEATTSPRRWR